MDVELLINAVEKRQMLYDKTCPDYSNRKYINAEWKEIAEEVGCDEKDARRKWKKLRDYFSRSHREMTSTSCKSGPPGSKKKKWYLYDRMQFVLPYIKDGNTSINYMSICSDEDDVDNVDTMSLVSASSFTSSPQFDTPTSLPTTTSEGLETQSRAYPPTQQNDIHSDLHRKRQRHFPQQIKVEPSEFENEMLKAVKRLGEKNVMANEMDEDEHFFKSLVPNMKVFSAIDKMECRAEIQMVVLRHMKKARQASSTSQKPEIDPCSSPNQST